MMNFRHETITVTNDIGVHFLKKVYESNICTKHWHNELEVIYMIEGTTEFICSGDTIVVKEGDLIVINSKEIHSSISHHRTVSILLQIPYEFLNANVPNFSRLYFECSPNSILNARQQLKLNELKENLIFFSELYQSQISGYQLKIKSLVLDILFVLVNQFGRYSTEVEYERSKKYFERLDRIIKYVEMHYTEDIDLQRIADVVALNPEYFARFFKRYMGITFFKYLNTIRLKHVYQELVNSDYSICVIATRNGFVNYKGFVTLFRDTYGMTPSQLRKSLKMNV